MKDKKMVQMFSVAVVATLVFGCGSSSVTTKASTSVTSGVVVDDYIQGATVCADANGNGKADDGDANCVITNTQGQFNFGVARAEPLVVSGGRDIGTGKEFRGTFLAPAGAKVINPLTTIVRSLEKTGKTLAQAQAIVKDKLGLPNVDLTTFDPLKEIQFSTDTAVQENAKKVLGQQSSIQVILTTVSTAIAATTSSISVADASVHVADKIADQLLTADTNNSTVDINSPAQIETIVTNATTATLEQAVTDQVITQSVVNTATTKVETIKTVLATQVSTIATTVVNSVEAVTVSGDETSGLAAIKESNAVLLLVTDETSPTTITNIIETTVIDGNTTTLDDVNVTAEIATATTELIERPVVINTDAEDSDVIETTGGEGGN